MDEVSRGKSKRRQKSLFHSTILTVLPTFVSHHLLQDHPWHIYAASTRRRSSVTNRTGDKSIPESVYLASTRSTAGRPTRAIMNRVLNGISPEYDRV